MAAGIPRPTVLCILDGFGDRESREANAVKLARTPNLAAMAEKYPTSTIGTSGPDVGLPVGQMGNSEVGHLNFGAGRIAQMDISRIDCAVADGTLIRNPVIGDLFHRAQKPHKRIHLMGLVSDGGVHSSLDHLIALIRVAAQQKLFVVVHAFLDGRDTPPKSARGYLEKLCHALERCGTIGTLCGRYWAMDRDKRWDRVHRAYQAIVRGTPAGTFGSVMEALEASYAAGKTDEFVEPVRIGKYAGFEGKTSGVHLTGRGEPMEWAWRSQETVLAFNFRPDRMRELAAMFTYDHLPPEAKELLTENTRPVKAVEPGHFACMTEYDAALKLPVAFTKEVVADSLGEVISRLGKTQLRCAETEKYAHVTYFFSGGREETFPGEDRKLIPSPRDVATYDLKPEMSAAEVTSAVVDAVEADKYDFILVNFANPDMVGHTGNLEAAIRAVEAVDTGVGKIWEAVQKKGGAMLVTADHGNCEQMSDAEGKPHTAHTTNRCLLYVASDALAGKNIQDGGRICDIAPTVLELMRLEKPAAMTGISLLKK